MTSTFSSCGCIPSGRLLYSCLFFFSSHLRAFTASVSNYAALQIESGSEYYLFGCGSVSRCVILFGYSHFGCLLSLWRSTPCFPLSLTLWLLPSSRYAPLATHSLCGYLESSQLLILYSSTTSGISCLMVWSSRHVYNPAPSTHPCPTWWHSATSSFWSHQPAACKNHHSSTYFCSLRRSCSGSHHFTMNSSL